MGAAGFEPASFRLRGVTLPVELRTHFVRKVLHFSNTIWTPRQDSNLPEDASKAPPYPLRSRGVGCPGRNRTDFLAAYKTACNDQSRQDFRLALPHGIEPCSTVLQTVANPSQLEKRGTDPRPRTGKPLVLSERGMPIPVRSAWYGSSASNRETLNFKSSRYANSRHFRLGP